MPIYEFYCQTCHMLFSFLSVGSTVGGHPDCPRCGRGELPKRPSTFAMLSHSEDPEEDPFAGIDEQRLEGAMDTLMREAGDVPEDADPRTMGRFLRRFTELSGLDIGPRLEDTLGRLERGEDLEALEAEMDEIDDGDEGLSELFRLKRALRGRRDRPPRVDEEIYFL